MKPISNPIVSAKISKRRHKHAGSSSKYYGVSWSKRYNGWQARFIFRDVSGATHTKHLGVFEEERDAALAYDKVAVHFNQPLNILKKHSNEQN